MSVPNEAKFVLITRQTRMEELIARFNSWPQAKFYLEHAGVDAQDYVGEHERYQRRVTEAQAILRAHGLFQRLDRTYLPSYQFGPGDVVVVLGQDGLVANTLKYLNGQAVIAINPDPERWDGKLLPFHLGDLERVLGKLARHQHDMRTVTFAEARTNLGQRMLAVNDLFIGPNSHSSAQYKLRWGSREERQSSSGIIVSTGFGSTGWMQSVLAGAAGVTGTPAHPLSGGFGWDQERLYFAVREPFPSKTSGVDLVFGELTAERPLQLESLMPEAGVIFSDGILEDAIAFNAGCLAEIGIAETRGFLVC